MSVCQCLIGLFCVSGVTGCDFRYEVNTCAAITKAICDCQLVTYWICILAHILCDTSVALLNLRASLVLESGGDIRAQVKKTVSTFAIQWGYCRPVEIYERSCIATLHVRLNCLVVPTLHISICSQEFMSQVQQIMTHSEHKVEISLFALYHPH